MAETVRYAEMAHAPQAHQQAMKTDELTLRRARTGHVHLSGIPRAAGRPGVLLTT
jgi:hypothetical protein